MQNFIKRLETIKKSLNIESLKKKIIEIEKESEAASFWQNHEKAAAKMRELAELQGIVEKIRNLENRIQNAEDKSQKPELKHNLEKELEELELKTFLGGKYDKNGALLSIHAGQGGTEAMDWAAMLLRMYLKYCANKNWKTEIVDEVPGEEAGIKSVTVEIDALYAYGYLKHEHGTHRLVRQSPFNADHLRQTSFALVEIVPLIEETADLEINPGDIEVATFRSSGPGGQHANKTESAVRAIHKPTGLTVSVSSSRSQLTNRKTALNLLRGKLYQLMQEQQVEKVQELKGRYKPASWGNQIRSYTLDPYQLVKDHRTKVEIGNAQRVLDGDLDKLIEAEISLLVS
ncbi:MAG: peptide chain release factor 2 [Chloroflexota bacterium]|nr:MAG: peptide chain release factor 2 [Chloroflexota bacterium]